MTTIKIIAEDRKTRMQSAVTADVILDLLNNFIGLSTTISTQITTPGLAQFAKDQNNDQTYDVVAEFNAAIATIDAVINNIVTTFPKDTHLTGLNPNTYQSFPPASTATLRGLLDNVIAAIA